jgi:hypothetical protein
MRSRTARTSGPDRALGHEHRPQHLQAVGGNGQDEQRGPAHAGASAARRRSIAIPGTTPSADAMIGTPAGVTGIRTRAIRAPARAARSKAGAKAASTQPPALSTPTTANCEAPVNTSAFKGLAQVMVVASPWGSSNWFASFFRRAADGETPGAATYQPPSAECNPNVTADELAAAEAEDPISFPSEYLTLFEMGGDGLFGDTEWSDRGEVPPDMMGGCVAGVDHRILVLDLGRPARPSVVVR